MLEKLIRFLTLDLWRIRTRDLSRRRALVVKPLRVIMRAARGFGENKCQLRASALTFYSLLSMVPIVAMAFGIAKGFGFEKLLEKLIMERLQGQEEVAAQLIAFANNLLQNVNGGVIAGIGVAVLFWTVIKVLGNIETSFNDIWGVKKGRPVMRKLSDYLSIMLICPLLLILSSSATIFIASQVTFLIEKLSFLGVFSPIILSSLKLLPFVAMWVLFTFIYIFMPNTKVRFKAGLLGGVTAGTIYQIFQWTYVMFQLKVTNYGAVYGSFAALPLFLAWLQISWLVVLLGAEISFAYQNIATYEFERECLGISYSFKKLLTLRIVSLAAKRFHKGEPALTEGEYSQELDIPIRLVRQILFELVDAGLFNEVALISNKEKAYQPSRSIEDLTVQGVVEILEDKGATDIPVLESPELDKLRACLAAFSKAVKDSGANAPVKDI